MNKIVVTREFKHMDLWAHHARAYPPATYTIVDRPSEAWECSPRCAEVALAEGWAVRAGSDSQVTGGRQTGDSGVTKPAAEAEKPARPTGSRTGEAKPSASSRPARRLRKSKPKK